MNVAGDVALVVGGTSGLGLATARRLLEDGCRVVVMGREPERAAKAGAELGGVPVVVGDVADEADVRTAVETAARLGRLGVAVNCAGTARMGRVLGRSGVLPLAEFAEVVHANLTGTFNLVRLAAEEMARNAVRDGDRGVIVCTASVAAFDGQEGQAAYAASKAGVVGMTLPLARDLARHAIRVVTVAPGPFETPMLAGAPQEVREALLRGTVHPGRLGGPEDFASLVAHIVDNPMLNGETIRLDGAMRLGLLR
ncbi:SDR family NAD(P)-dependent oxidoreductase [Streptomyces sp. CB01881]|uniref:SDR family NAD(P)-dependent oxidoreductase n=1 Tax=Streptomyces sp. CB01881 TaxID=2078691 RepID=UPI0011DFA7A8|nr:SDR family NAD(P)-dependent oxidoreductase [Streptomyces sp. CB01881]TYC64540.1 SDR family NAD(P)-dependent oxidoreductase [Streptomyces sp. CB01881]